MALAAAVALCGCPDRAHLDRLWHNPVVDKKEMMKKVKEEAEKKASARAKLDLGGLAKKKKNKYKQRLSTTTQGFDPQQFPSAARMYETARLEKAKGPTKVKALVESVDAALGKGKAVEDRQIWSALNALNPYRLQPVVREARRRWAKKALEQIRVRVKDAVKVPALPRRGYRERQRVRALMRRRYNKPKVDVPRTPSAVVRLHPFSNKRIPSSAAARRVMIRGARCVRSRYWQALKRNDTLAGKITPCVTLNTMGRVTRVVVDADVMGDANLTGSIKLCLKRLRFPPLGRAGARVCATMVLERKQGRGQHILWPSSASHGLRQVNYQYKRGRLGDASRGYRRLLEYFPGNPDIRNNLALSQLHVGQDLAAWLELEILKGLRPKYLPADVNLTTVLERSRDFKAAGALAASLAGKHPKVPQAAFNAAWYSNLANDHAAATRMLQPFKGLPLRDRGQLKKLLAVTLKTGSRAAVAREKEAQQKKKTEQKKAASSGYTWAWTKAVVMAGLAGVWKLREDHKTWTVIGFIVCWAALAALMGFVGGIWFSDSDEIRRVLLLSATMPILYGLMWGLGSGWSWLWAPVMVWLGYGIAEGVEDEL